jgi:hypothetical protein
MPGKGFPPKPTALKVLEGRPGHHPVNRNEPQFRAEIPERLAGLTRGARKFWDEYIGILGIVPGLLTAADARALAGLCEDQALLKELRDGQQQLESQMRRDAKSKNLRMLTNPQTMISRTEEGQKTFSIMAKLNSQIMNREREFGLMPGSRSRVEVAPPIPGAQRRMDPIEAALCGDIQIVRKPS